MTDITYLKQGGQTTTNTLPFGHAHIARAVSDKLEIPMEVAYSYLELFTKGNLDEATTEAIDKIVTISENNWIDVWKSVDKETTEDSIPYSIFLITLPGFGKLLKTFLESVFPDHSIILIGETNTFTKEIVVGFPEEIKDEKILLISSFSNLHN